MNSVVLVKQTSHKVIHAWPVTGWDRHPWGDSTEHCHRMGQSTSPWVPPLNMITGWDKNSWGRDNDLTWWHEIFLQWTVANTWPCDQYSYQSCEMHNYMYQAEWWQVALMQAQHNYFWLCQGMSVDQDRIFYNGQIFSNSTLHGV